MGQRTRHAARDGDAADAVCVCRGGLDGELQGVEGDAGVAADGRGQRLDRLVVHVDCQLAEAALAVGEGAANEDLDLRLVQRLEGEDAGAGEEGPDDLERGVLGRGADEGDGAVLDIREDGVLLGFVEAVDLVDEEDGLLPSPRACFGHNPSQVGDAGGDGGDGDEVGGGLGRDDAGERRLAGARRAPEDDGR